MNKNIGVLCMISLASVTSTSQALPIKLANNTQIELQITFRSDMYHGPQITTITAGGTGTAFLDDLADKNISKDTTVQVRGDKLHTTSWTFRQIDMVANMNLVFSMTEDSMLSLTVEMPSGAAFIQQPDGQ